MPFELTEAGLSIESTVEVRESINEELYDTFGRGIDLSDGTVSGQTIAIIADRISAVGELVQAVHNAFDPDANTGAAQDSIAAITGCEREDATESTVLATLTGDTGTVIAIGSRAGVVGTEDEFETLELGTLAALAAWAGSTAYVIGDRRTNGGNAYEAVGAGTSAGSGGPTGTDPADVVGETDGTVLWRFLGEGVAADDVEAQATETGAITCNAAALTEIATPVSGWLGVVNMEDATLGTAIESNAAFRVRREVELRLAATSPVDAIRADLLEVEGVTACTVFHNVEDVTDADGVPPHAFEALVEGGEDQDIWDQLLASGAGGIKTYGDEVGTATDSAGNVWPMAFSRPGDLDIYVTLHVIKDRTTYPSDGDDQIKAAIVAFGDAQLAGKDVVASSIGAQGFSVAGVLDIPAAQLFIGTAPAPASAATIPASLRERARFDTSRIVITTENGTP
jgi:uncharacterized phage protein gp47/JayE